jgi:hypothetical protein
MTHALIITAKPSGGLTYADNDVVQILDGHQNPGAAVTPTDSGFLFCYISDKDHDDPDVLALMSPWEDDTQDPPEQLGKRRYQVTLTGSEFETWVPEDEAHDAGIEKTWAEIQALTTDKAGD